MFGLPGSVTQFVAEPFDLQSTRWVYGLPGILTAQLLSFTPIAFLIMIGVVEGVSPSMEEAAQTLRVNRWETFRTVTLPLMRPGLANAFLLGFIQLRGFTALGIRTRIIGISDDHEVDIKKVRVRNLANNALLELGLTVRVAATDVEVISAIDNTYGVPDAAIISGIQLLARTEGLIADPVYEGRAIRGLLNLAGKGRFDKNAKVLLMHLGGSPAIHAYAEQFDPVQLQPFYA